MGEKLRRCGGNWRRKSVKPTAVSASVSNVAWGVLVADSVP